MTRLHTVLKRGLSGTAALWPDVQVAYGWVQRVADGLRNEAGHSGTEVRSRLAKLMRSMGRHADTAGELAQGLRHFLKVTRSYRPGLFHCYDVPDLPRTNNDLEHLFGSHRYHERRASGRKVASPSLVLRGSVRILAATATRLRAIAAEQLPPTRIEDWRKLRENLDQRRHTRTLRRRFRQDPKAYLADLEGKVSQLTLPP